VKAFVAEIRLWLLLLALFLGLPVALLIFLMAAMIDLRIPAAIVVGIFACGIIGQRLLDRRTRLRQGRGLCLACGYCLTANVSGICPECGIVVGGKR
jgi:hypothetical protein